MVPFILHWNLINSKVQSAFKYLKNQCQALGWSHKEGPVPTSIVLPVLSSPQPAELGLYPKRLPWAPISVSGHVLLHLRLISPDLMPSTAHNTGLAHLNPKNQGSGKREVCTTQTEGQDGEWPQTQPPKEAKSILLTWNYQEPGSKSILCLSVFVVVVVGFFNLKI